MICFCSFCSTGTSIWPLFAFAVLLVSHRLVLSLCDPLTTVAPCHVLYMTLTSSLDCRRLGPVVKYLSDVMLPDGLFGPVIGFVIRLKFFS